MHKPASIKFLNDAIKTCQLDCAEIVGAAVTRMNDPASEGARTFVARNYNAEKEAKAFDILRKCHATTSPLAGLPISIKDNIDIEGQPTTAGSVVLRSQPPAKRDAAIVTRLRSAGAVIMGRTNMSEFAFSGVGANPHHGTPLNPFDRNLQRIPGGSSSGASVSVADGMSVAAIGTDTGGSVRIPAALCGLTGFKPTQARVSRTGVFPLSNALDCVGVIAARVDDCRIVDEIISGQIHTSFVQHPKLIRLCILPGPMMDTCDGIVGQSFDSSLKVLRDSGISITNSTTDIFNIMDEMGARGSYAAAEAWESLGYLMEAHGKQIDQNIVERIKRGRTITAADFIRNNRDRLKIISTIDTIFENFDCIVSPTVPIIAPRLCEIQEPANFHKINQILLRNPSAANLLDIPSITIPCNAPGKAPVGLMLMGKRHEDGMLLAIASTIEEILQSSWRLGRKPDA